MISLLLLAIVTWSWKAVGYLFLVRAWVNEDFDDQLRHFGPWVCSALFPLRQTDAKVDWSLYWNNRSVPSFNAVVYSQSVPAASIKSILILHDSLHPLGPDQS